MPKIKILLFGSRNRQLLGTVKNEFKECWIFEQPDFTFFKSSITDEDGVVCCLFDSDAQVSKELHRKMSSLQAIHPFALLAIQSSHGSTVDLPGELLLFLSEPVSQTHLYQAIRLLADTVKTKKELVSAKRILSSQGQELKELTKIGVALSAERDPDALLEMILTKAREITTADAGSLYLVEKNPDVKARENDFWADKQLRFKLAQNDSLEASYKEFVMPAAKQSMAGYTALTGHPLNIKDAYRLSAGCEFQHNRSFDDKMGYRTKSVLCIPMVSHQGEMIGLLQLINRKKHWGIGLTPENVEQQVIAFDSRCEELASSLASQAAVSIENMRLYEEIQRLFEGFIVASVHAIEQRDPTTSGHSERVAELTVELAQQIDRLDQGNYKEIRFSRDDIQQIKYAALLHDFGKIGVREHVLVKAKKLYPEQLDIVQWRFKFIKKSLELEYSKKKLEKILQASREEIAARMEGFEHEFEQHLKDLDNYLQFVIEANEPKILAEGGQHKLVEIAELVYRENGLAKPYLEKEEIHLLSIPRGSLSPEERVEIESHVTHTFNFLNRIPWASHLKAVPQIAYAHHEKLDGSGYPRNLTSPQIPLPSKMMTISDIYDALTASDRPYKRAVPPEKALEILGYEMQEGKIEPELYRIFVDAKIYQVPKSQ